MELQVGDFIIRDLNVEDTSDVYEILGDKERSWWLGWLEPLDDLNDARDYIDYCLDGCSSYGSFEEIEYAIVLNEKVVGIIGISKQKDISTAEFGYVMHKDYEGQGIMPQIVKAFCKELFMNEKMNKLKISAMECNKRSWRVAEKCGFYKTKETGSRMDGRPLDIYCLTKEDFISNMSKAS